MAVEIIHIADNLRGERLHIYVWELGVLLSVTYINSSDVNRAPADVQNTKICCAVFRTVFHPSGRNQYPERSVSNYDSNHKDPYQSCGVRGGAGG
jgi:hypothetical protein